MKTEKIKSICVGKEAKTSKEGIPYGIITVMDGSAPLNLVTKDNNVFNSVELYKPLEMVLDIKLGKYTKVEIVSISTLKE